MSTANEGLIGYFGLHDWWLTTFNAAEREHIEKNGFGNSSLTQGVVTATSHTAYSVIIAMAGFWKPTAAEEKLIAQLNAKAEELLSTQPERRNESWPSIG